MSSCMEVSQWLTRPGGPQLINDAMHLAIQGCRRDIECECVEVNDEAGTRWWDTQGGLFTGQSVCDNDVEFQQMRDQAVSFLDRAGAIERHPSRPHLIRFFDLT